VVLLGGDPGIGKSTLLLEISADVALRYGSVIYVSAEESAEQVKLRAERLGIDSDQVLVLAENDVDQVIDVLEAYGKGEAGLAHLVIIDSIQSVATGDLASSAGTISQVRECAQRLVDLAKRRQVALILVGHVTKEGVVAGPRVLEHLVDAVLYLEGERFSNYRILRGVKNRFGSTDEIGLFEMRDRGLVEVEDAAAMFLSQGRSATAGAIAALVLEGTRPLVVEVQALAVQAAYGPPRRQVNGYDLNRLHVLLAVLSKRANLPVQTHDIYVNVVGGVRLTEPAADLPVALAVASSLGEAALPRELAATGEVGLSGELRPVGQLERRLAEAARLGFRRVIVPQQAGAGVSRLSHELRVEQWPLFVQALGSILGSSLRARQGNGGHSSLSGQAVVDVSLEAFEVADEDV
jgi:DNA repair protein RadA/Sms